MSYTSLGRVLTDELKPGMVGKTGVVPGKFFPPHRGHLTAIIRAATVVEKLYVVVSDNASFTEKKCKEAGLPIMDLRLRAKWLSKELSGFDHIKVLMLDETGIPEYPNGWKEWSGLLNNLIPEKIDVLFGGEQEYRDVNDIYFPGVQYVLIDPNRDRFPISGTEIRNHPLKHWDYILGSARPFFAKKVLIAGSESCGKTTITKYLAKIYHTSWSEEVGRYYSQRYLGGNDDVFAIEDFEKIAELQYEQDMEALRTSNRVVFYDTDAVVTQFYCGVYLGKENPEIERWVDPSRYDIVILFTPEVTWVNDGTRFMGDTKKRWENHEKIKKMYKDRGFHNIVEVTGSSYNERLNKAMEIVDNLIDK